MSKEISLFSNYHSNENRVTNYCGLVMKMLYLKSPTAFQDVISSLISNTDISFDILPSFKQQIKQKKSVPDLEFSQKSFTVYFETKVTDWFYEDQINRHLDGLFEECNSDIKILFLLTSEFLPDSSSRLDSSIKMAKEKSIIMQEITFEDFLLQIKASIDLYLKNDDSIYDIVTEFENYLSQENYLPEWKQIIDIINCTGSQNEVEIGLYACPIAGGAYNHKRAKYFGSYCDKKVNYISEILGMIEVSGDDLSSEVKWNNSAFPNNELIDIGLDRLRKCEDWRIEQAKRKGNRIFVLGERKKVNCVKESKGGMQYSKTYWKINSNNIDELIDEINTKIW